MGSRKKLAETVSIRQKTEQHSIIQRIGVNYRPIEEIEHNTTNCSP